MIIQKFSDWLADKSDSLCWFAAVVVLSIFGWICLTISDSTMVEIARSVV